MAGWTTKYIESTFINKPWTKPKMKGVKPLPDDAFESPQSWANFVFMHEIMHNKLKPDLQKTSTSAAEYENDGLDAIFSPTMAPKAGPVEFAYYFYNKYMSLRLTLSNVQT